MLVRALQFAFIDYFYNPISLFLPIALPLSPSPPSHTHTHYMYHRSSMDDLFTCRIYHNHKEYIQWKQNPCHDQSKLSMLGKISSIHSDFFFQKIGFDLCKCSPVETLCMKHQPNFLGKIWSICLLLILTKSWILLVEYRDGAVLDRSYQKSVKKIWMFAGNFTQHVVLPRTCSLVACN